MFGQMGGPSVWSGAWPFSMVRLEALLYDQTRVPSLWSGPMRGQAQGLSLWDICETFLCGVHT